MPYTPERTRAAIYEAAVQEFVNYGFAGARVERIARNANVDKKAIYFYFGDKRGLYEEVLDVELSSTDDDVPIDPRDMAGYVARLFDHQRSNPGHLRLIMWQALEFDGSEEFPGKEGGTAYCHQRPGPISEAQAQGTVDPTLDAAGAWLALTGMVDWVLGVSTMTRMTFGDDPERLDQQRAVLMECARRIFRQEEPDLAPVMGRAS